jgi:peptidoglycan hydrolase-like protein with peptidoglycan-binding domain
MKKNILAAVISLGIFLSPALAQAQASGLTSSQVNAIISFIQSFGADQSVIDSVRAALSGGTPTSGGQTFCHTFNNDLTIGSTDKGAGDVSALNDALSIDSRVELGGDDVFTENTAAAVVKFQGKYGIRQSGYVGPQTRAKLNSLYGCRDQTSITTATTTTTTPQPSICNAQSSVAGCVVGPTTTAPFISSTNGKAAGNFEMDAGADANVLGTNLAGNGPGTTAVYIGGIAASVVHISDDRLDIMVPSSLIAGQNYSMFVTNSNGTSNAVIIHILSNVTNPSASSALTSVQIQSIVSLLFSLGASNSAIMNVTTILSGGTVTTTNFEPSRLTSAQVQSILTLLASFGAGSQTISNVSKVLSAGTPTTVPSQAASITGPLTVSADTPFTIAGTGSPVGSSLTVALSNVPNASGDTVGPATVQANGTWSLYFNFGLPNGSYPITVRGNGGLTSSALVTGTLIVSTLMTTNAPTVTLSAATTSVAWGGSAGITWSSTNATSCTRSNGDPGWALANGLNGTVSSYPIYRATTFTMTCVGAGGSATQSVTITARPQLFSYTTGMPVSVQFSQSPKCACDVSQARDCQPSFVSTDQGPLCYEIYNAQTDPLGGPNYQSIPYSRSSGQAAFNSPVFFPNTGLGAGPSYTWRADLRIGSPLTADITALQIALTKEGLYSGPITGGFFSQTYAGVVAFQQKYDIAATGYVGPDTRAKLNSLYSR